MVAFSNEHDSMFATRLVNETASATVMFTPLGAAEATPGIAAAPTVTSRAIPPMANPCRRDRASARRQVRLILPHALPAPLQVAGPADGASPVGLNANLHPHLAPR